MAKVHDDPGVAFMAYGQALKTGDDNALLGVFAFAANVLLHSPVVVGVKALLW